MRSAPFSFLKKAKATPSQRGLNLTFCYVWISLRLGLLGPIAAHMKELLHFTAFISAFLRFIRAIRHLSEGVFGAADHLEHWIHRFGHSSCSFRWNTLKREERQRKRSPQLLTALSGERVSHPKCLSGDFDRTFNPIVQQTPPDFHHQVWPKMVTVAVSLKLPAQFGATLTRAFWVGFNLRLKFSGAALGKFGELLGESNEAWATREIE
jgi:hypothetical protein